MKRADPIRHLGKHGCVFVREGGNQTIYKNKANGVLSSVPRQREAKEVLARKICDDLNIPRP